ncbi:MAG: hypothetical protein JJ975_04940 [Bacteroidia bacterium]|nr:hypothetical protein [Bacteroidia bacterium]
MKEEILDTGLEKKNTLREAITWWESKRLIFNLIVGLVGGLATLIFMTHFGLFDLAGVLMWGVVANIMYSVGLVLEIWNYHYFNNRLTMTNWRWPLFVLGTVAYAIVSWIYAKLYYSYWPI